MFQTKTLSVISSELSSEEHNIPILPETFNQFSQLFESNEYEHDLNNLVSIILNDPFLSLKLLLKISKRKRTNISLEIDSIKKSLMMLGIKELFDITLNSSVAIKHDGLAVAIKRAQYSSFISKELSIKRHDILPEEVQLSTLLADLGELILWVFNPSIPKSVRDSMDKNEYKRNQEAQIALAGFRFKDLSISLAHSWSLPSPIIEIVESSLSERAKISKVCVDLSRHLNEHNGYLAIPDDIIEIHRLLSMSYPEILNITRLKDNLTIQEFKYVTNKLYF